MGSAYAKNLVAAGVDVRLALAAVLVYRLVTYVLPIAVGFVLYLRWRVSAVHAVPAAGVDLVLIEGGETTELTVISPAVVLAAAS